MHLCFFLLLSAKMCTFTHVLVFLLVKAKITHFGLNSEMNSALSCYSSKSFIGQQ